MLIYTCLDSGARIISKANFTICSSNKKIRKPTYVSTVRHKRTKSLSVPQSIDDKRTTLCEYGVTALYGEIRAEIERLKAIADIWI